MCGVPVHGKDISNIAKDFANLMKITDFHHFHDRHGIININKHVNVKSASVNTDAVNPFKEHLQALVKKMVCKAVNSTTLTKPGCGGSLC